MAGDSAVEVDFGLLRTALSGVAERADYYWYALDDLDGEFLATCLTVESVIYNAKGPAVYDLAEDERIRGANDMTGETRRGGDVFVGVADWHGVSGWEPVSGFNGSE